MKRILTMSLALSVLVLPACKGGASADAVKLVPDEADFIMGASPKAIAESELYKKFSPEFKDSSDYKEGVGMFEDCGLKPLEFDAVVVGGTSESDFVVVIAGASVGKADSATCVVKAIQKENGDEEKAEVTKEDGKDVVNFDKGRVYLVNDNLVAIASTGWQGAVGELIDGKGKSAADNSKKDLLGKVDHKKAMWFVANVPSDMANMAGMAAPEATEVKTVIGAMDLSKGIALDLVAGFGDNDKAKAAADAVQAMFDGVKGMAPPDLKGVVDSVKIEASGSDVKLAVSASVADLEAAKKASGM
jgi:hypothetical protein